MRYKIYIASPYTIGDQALNVKKQMEAANKIFDLGHIPFIPLLAHFQHMFFPREYEEWLDYDLKWIESCDILLRLPGESKGADIEVEHAKKLNKGICYGWRDLDITLNAYKLSEHPFFKKALY